MTEQYIFMKNSEIFRQKPEVWLIFLNNWQVKNMYDFNFHD